MPTKRMLLTAGAIVAACWASAALPASDTGRGGYYRYPSVHGDTVIFTSEGDLWSVDIHGGAAQRLTSDSGQSSPWRRFPRTDRPWHSSRNTKGPSEVYTMPHQRRGASAAHLGR